MKDRIVFTPEESDRILTIDGKKYRMLKETFSGGHIKDVIFEEFNEEEINKKIDDIAEYLISKSGLDSKTIIKDLLKQMQTIELDKLEKLVIKEEPVEIVPGCLSLKIGKRMIGIV